VQFIIRKNGIKKYLNKLKKKKKGLKSGWLGLWTNGATPNFVLQWEEAQIMDLPLFVSF
jgi:hypothetical protein